MRYAGIRGLIRIFTASAANILPSLLLMFVCLEILGIITAYILVSTGASAGFWKYMRREVYLTLLLLLPVLLPGWPGKLYSLFIYIILSLFTAGNLIYATLYDAPISSSLFSVFRETYFSETAGFIKQYFSWRLLLCALIPFILAGPFLILSLKKRPQSMRGAWIFALLILILFSVKCLDRSPGVILQRHYLMDFLISCAAEYEEQKKFSATANPTLPAELSVTLNMGQLLVLVIGESSSRHHYGLYGYQRDTTPCLASRQDELLIFSDVISPHAHTIPSLQKALIFANHAGDAPACNVIDVFRAAGYQTIVLSNQPRLGVHDTAASRLLSGAHIVRFVNSVSVGSLYTSPSYDEVLLEPLRKSLGDITPYKNTLLVLHLMGSHSPYESRYPTDAIRFSDSPPPYAAGFPLDKKKIEMIQEYDNSIAYTDSFLGQVIEILDELEHPAALLYFSDHSDAVYEDGLTAGHAEDANSRYMFEIPFIIWLSDEYKLGRPGFFEKISSYTDRPWQTDDLIYPLLNLAGIDFEGLKADRDILSEEFMPEKRLMNGQDYDRLFSDR